MIVMHCLKPSHQLSMCAVPKHDQKWTPVTPPPAGWLCLNVDTAVFSSSSSSAVGVVVREYMGRCLMGCRRSFLCITAPEVAEGLALLCAVIIALDEGFHKVIMQSHCFSLINKVTASTRDRSMMALLLRILSL
ncbi:hypothetical protein BAE44_0025073 [Dichanthelium oligosanthes]|uniref:RNase H type-1 domain-containing protein n=1 Tax=Dichanthelium oligosanthes TaxID=888268 RepID=A0A1E5UM01_9POAL|nr:hypothetical protein BAE44_0025073 [Dichanthelium oligosanthes]